LLITHLPAPGAGAAGHRCFARSGAGASAVFAGLVPADRDLGLCAEDSLFELQGDILTQISAALSTAAPARTSAENVAESEKVAKDVAEVLEDGGVKAAATANTSDARVAEAVVKSPLLAIRENRVGLAGFLEFFFRVRIIGVAIRMKLQGELAVRALDLLVAGAARYAEHFIIVAFSVTGQNGLSQILSSFVVSLMLRVPRDLDHLGTQQPVLELVATLHFFEHMMILGVVGFHHFDRLVKMRIERLVFRGNRPQTQFP